jgi:hypothetical protein
LFLAYVFAARQLLNRRMPQNHGAVLLPLTCSRNTLQPSVATPQSILMLVNGVAILNNDRFLEKCEWQ